MSTSETSTYSLSKLLTNVWEKADMYQRCVFGGHLKYFRTNFKVVSGILIRLVSMRLF